MNRQEIVRKIAEKTGLEQKAVQEVINQFLKEVEAVLLSGRSLQVRSFGTFVLKKRRAKIGRNPLLNEPVPVPAHLTVTFKPSPRLKKKLNQRPESGKSVRKTEPVKAPTLF